MSHSLRSGRMRLSGLCALLLAASAHAQLGGNETSIAADAQALGGMPVREAAGISQTSWQIRTAAGVVHEYVGPSGQVYAVTFNGSSTPRLDVLLGSYAATFSTYARHDRRGAVLDLPNLQARLHGHPGSVGGVVWLPGLVPPGVNTGALQ